MEKFFELIRGEMTNPMEDDSLVWIASKGGHYTVKSNMELLEGEVTLFHILKADLESTSPWVLFIYLGVLVGKVLIMKQLKSR